MSRHMTRSWLNIREYYDDLCEKGPEKDQSLPIRAMLTLVEAIENSQYAFGLYAWTSMFDLCIVQAEVSYPYDGPYLRVSPLPEGKIEFRFVDSYYKEKQWRRVVEAKDAFQRLEIFLDQLHWFNLAP